MDEEETAGFRESCPQCGALDWSLSEEGGFYCRGCYGAIERTREVLDPSLNRGTSRISTLGRGSRTRKQGSGWMWRVCEGFQFILSRQAEALQALGACDWATGLKDGVLGPLWRLYLQKSRQAFPSQGGASDRSRTSRREMEAEIELDSGAETSILSGLTDSEGNPPSPPPTDQRGSSGSLDGGVLKASGPGRMSMPKTLALLYLSLMWSREGLTLSDLLRLVRGDLVPYLKAYLLLPEEMQLFGKDAAIFHVQGVPSHRAIQQEAQNLVHFLQLPAFPPISRQCLIHPALLSQRYLTDLNLPDELHVCVCGLMERTHLDEPLTFDPESQPVLPAFDLLAAALVIVAMKAAFGLDDHAEWELSNAVNAKNDPGLFSLRRWFRLVETALIRVQQQEEQQLSRKSWRPDTHIVSSRRQKYTVIKLKRTADQVQTCFRRLSSGGGAPGGGASSFRFCWGGEPGAHGPPMHHLKLDRVLDQVLDRVLVPRGELDQDPDPGSYWHPALKPCSLKCGSHLGDQTLPASFLWLLRLFGFLLDLDPPQLYEQVLEVERRLLGTRTPAVQTRTRARTRTRASPETTTRTRIRARPETRTRPETGARARTRIRTSPDTMNRTRSRSETRTRTSPETRTRTSP